MIMKMSCKRDILVKDFEQVFNEEFFLTEYGVDFKELMFEMLYNKSITFLYEEFYRKVRDTSLFLMFTTLLCIALNVPIYLILVPCVISIFNLSKTKKQHRAHFILLMLDEVLRIEGESEISSETKELLHGKMFLLMKNMSQ